MFDTAIRPKIDPYLNTLATQLGGLGIGPNQITLYGFVVGLVGCVAIGLQSYVFGLFLILINRLGDGLDGAVARQKAVEKTTKNNFGTYLDIILDMVLFGAFVFLFILGKPETAAVGAFLMFSFIGLFATSLSRYIVGKDNETDDTSCFHPTRLIEGTELILFMVVVCLSPASFMALAILLGVMCWVTAISRVWKAFWDIKTGQTKED